MKRFSVDKQVSLVSDCGVAFDQGGRGIMEDTYVILPNFGGKKEWSFYAVYDGHGGNEGAETASNILHEVFLAKLTAGVSAKRALPEAFLATDGAIEAQSPVSGTTAAVVFFERDKLLVGNVGDTRVVVERGGKAQRLTRDHRADDPSERKGVEERGGRIANDYSGVARVGGVLMLTRSLGDASFGKIVSPLPDTQEVKLTKAYNRMIIACDGVWDVLGDQETLDLIRPTQSAEAASRLIVSLARNRGSEDNITAVVVDFRFA